MRIVGRGKKEDGGGGEHTAPTNAAFDESLRRENPQWGVRDLEAVEGVGNCCAEQPCAWQAWA